MYPTGLHNELKTTFFPTSINFEQHGVLEIFQSFAYLICKERQPDKLHDYDHDKSLWKMKI